MTLSLHPLHDLFAVEARGADLRRPLDAETVAEIRAAIDGHGVVVIRNPEPLSDAAHIAFSRQFGPLQRQKMLNMLGKSKTRLSSAEMIDVSNLDPDGNIYAEDDRRRKFGQGNLLWHSDVTFDANRATYSFLAAHTLPPSGGDTEYADMRGAYDALPAEMKSRIDGLVAEHSIWYSRSLGGLSEVSDEEKATRPPAQHPLVHVVPGTDRKALYLACHASHIVGWPKAEGRALLDELTAFATRPEFVYRHVWRPGDLVIWNNLSTMHRATAFDDTVSPRDMRRTTVLEHPDP